MAEQSSNTQYLLTSMSEVKESPINITNHIRPSEFHEYRILKELARVKQPTNFIFTLPSSMELTFSSIDENGFFWYGDNIFVFVRDKTNPKKLVILNLGDINKPLKYTLFFSNKNGAFTSDKHIFTMNNKSWNVVQFHDIEVIAYPTSSGVKTYGFDKKTNDYVPGEIKMGEEIDIFGNKMYVKKFITN